MSLPFASGGQSSGASAAVPPVIIHNTMTEDEMVGWHHRLNEHEFEQTPGESEGQGSLACCSPWGHKELYKT